MALRASKSNIWANCPGSTALPEIQNPDHLMAKKGTLCHLLTQLLIEGRIKPEASDVLNADPELIYENKTGIPVADDMVELAEGAASFARMITGAEGEGVCEQFFDDKVLPKGVTGTADYFTLDRMTRRLHVVDFKFGYTPVPAEKNTQLLCYSLGAVAYYGGLPDVAEIALHVYQPNNYSTGPSSYWVLTPDEWNREIEGLHAAAALARSQKGETRTGPWCVWCPSRLACRAFLTTATTVAETVDLTPDGFQLTPEQCGVLLHHLRDAESFVTSARKSIEDAILTHIRRGSPVKGWCVTQGAGRRAWSGSVDEIRAIGAMCGVDLIKEVPVTITEAWEKKEVRPFLDAVISKKEGAAKLTPFNKSTIKKRFNQ